MHREYPSRPVASARAAVLRGERVLLVLRADEPSKGLWSLPGGVIELGETTSQSVQRELAEECAVAIEVGPLLRVEDNIVRDDSGRIRFHYVVTCVLARHVAGRARAGSDAASVRWATRQELGALDMHAIARCVALEALDTAGG